MCFLPADHQMTFYSFNKSLQNCLIWCILQWQNDEDTLKVLDELSDIPDLIILDLDLNDKNGLECLLEIKANKKFESLPVVVYGTTTYPAVINQLYQGGAHLYLHESENSGLKTLIHHVLSINWKEKIAQPPREEFVL